MWVRISGAEGIPARSLNVGAAPRGKKGERDRFRPVSDRSDVIERLFEIANQVTRIFQPDRKPDQAGRDAQLILHFGG